MLLDHLFARRNAFKVKPYVHLLQGPLDDSCDDSGGFGLAERNAGAKKKRLHLGAQIRECEEMLGSKYLVRFGGVIFFNSPLFGDDSLFDSYFSNGLKPPTSGEFCQIWPY